MRFSVSRVDGRKTFLGFNHRSIAWQRFLDTRNVARKYSMPPQLQVAAADFFLHCIRGLLDDNELEVAQTREGRPSVTVQRNGNVRVTCQPTEVIPDQGRRLNGVKPVLTFKTDRGDLTVTAFLRRQGRPALEVIEDYLTRVAQPIDQADGIRRAKIERTASGVYVSSLERVPKTISAMKRIYSKIDPDRFEEVAGLLAGSKAEMGDASRGHLANQYAIRRRDLLPSRLRI
jgi:hypothetical protein